MGTYLYTKLKNYILSNKDYYLLPINKPLCVVEYRDDGSTKNIIIQYFKNPRGFLYYRKYQIVNGINLYVKFKNACHYVANKIILKERFSFFLFNGILIPAIPFGVILFFYLKLNKR